MQTPAAPSRLPLAFAGLAVAVALLQHVVGIALRPVALDAVAGPQLLQVIVASLFTAGLVVFAVAQWLLDAAGVVALRRRVPAFAVFVVVLVVARAAAAWALQGALVASLHLDLVFATLVASVLDIACTLVAAVAALWLALRVAGDDAVRGPVASGRVLRLRTSGLFAGFYLLGPLTAWPAVQAFLRLRWVDATPQGLLLLIGGGWLLMLLLAACAFAGAWFGLRRGVAAVRPLRVLLAALLAFFVVNLAARFLGLLVPASAGASTALAVTVLLAFVAVFAFSFAICRRLLAMRADDDVDGPGTGADIRA